MSTGILAWMGAAWWHVCLPFSLRLRNLFRTLINIQRGQEDSYRLHGHTVGKEIKQKPTDTEAWCVQQEQIHIMMNIHTQCRWGFVHDKNKEAFFLLCKSIHTSWDFSHFATLPHFSVGFYVIDKHNWHLTVKWKEQYTRLKNYKSKRSYVHVQSVPFPPSF